jgi:RHS repeat-associated protein
VRLSLDDTGTVFGTSEWDAWGTLRSSTGSGCGFGWAGEQFDASSDLTYLRARYYSSGTARFLSRDTVQPNAGGTTGYNPYAYANGNPVTFSDPSGHFTLSDIVRWVGGGVAAIFAYMAAVLECFSTGSCRYKGDWGDSSKGDLTNSKWFVTQANRVTSRAASRG